MDFHRRRLAGFDGIASSTLDTRSETLAEEVDPTNTIAPYHSALNGVNQPLNMMLKDATWIMLGGLACLVLGIRLLQILWMHLRLISAMSVPGDRQTYWKTTQWSWVPWLKVNLLWAPLWRKRQDREIKVGKVDIGTIPSRLHTLFLVVLVGTSTIYMLLLDWTKENKYALFAEVRGRSGTMCLAHLVVLALLATRNNPLINWLKISYDTFNLIHRWLGRLVVVEAVVHTVAWAIVQHADGGWATISDKLVHNLFCGSGMGGTIAMVLILLTSLSPVRHAFYETFLNFHVILAFIVFVCTYIHCVSAEIGYLPQTTWMIGIFVIWMAERLWRLFTLAYNNWSSRGYTEAIVEAMPGECTRVTLHLPRYLDVKPGSHAHLRFKGVSPWESHPFSIAWVEHTPDSRALPVAEKAFEGESIDKRHSTTSVSFIIGAQGGFTRKLYNLACSNGESSMSIRAAMEGPYAGYHSLESYGHAVLFAGSTGITHQMSFLRPLIEGFNAGTIATRRITLVWIVRDYESLEWVRPWMDTVLRLPNRKDILRIQLFVTRPKNPTEISSRSSTVQMFPGRPNISTLLKKEAQEQQGAMYISVCGSGSLADQVRLSAREMQRDHQQVVSLNVETFHF